MNDKPLKVRITGDVGRPSSISIVDADTGQKFTNVLEIDIHIGETASDNKVWLMVWGAELDLTGTVRPQVKDGELVTDEVTLT